MPRWITVALLCLCATTAGCGSTGDRPVEATSFLGTPLVRPRLEPDARAAQTAILREARAARDDDPDSIDAWIWVGRRTAYLGRYREAIRVYTEALERFPGEPRLLRHRGHRFITLRDLDRAIADLDDARRVTRGTPDRTEPDGLPNELGIPLSTLHTNIHYHLGLARYLGGDFAGSRSAYLEGLEASTNPDMASAMTYWLVLGAWRTGADPRELLGSIDRDATIIENDDYHAMLLAFAGEGDLDALLADARAAGGTRFATVGY